MTESGESAAEHNTEQEQDFIDRCLAIIRGRTVADPLLAGDESGVFEFPNESSDTLTKLFEATVRALGDKYWIEEKQISLNGTHGPHRIVLTLKPLQPKPTKIDSSTL